MLINSMVLLASPSANIPRPRFLSDVFPLGGTINACESKVVTPSNTLPTSVMSSYNPGPKALTAGSPLDVTLPDTLTAASVTDVDD